MSATVDQEMAELRRINEELLKGRDAALDELRQRTEALNRRDSEYGERIDQQAATIDVLRAMSSSPGDPQPVFDLIVRHATELCNGVATALYQFDGSLVHFRALYHSVPDPGAPAELATIFPVAPTREIIACRAIIDEQIVHIPDTEVEPGLSQAVRQRLQKSHRSQVSIPLMREGHAIGAISLGGKEPGGFTDSQIALMQTFAEQATIAITSAETYRALQARTTDLQESLEYQTATSDVLKAISQSNFDVQPVLDELVQTAARLCDADQAVIVRSDGQLIWLAANFGFPAEYETFARSLGAFPLEMDTRATAHRALRERQVVHIHDVAAVPGYPDVPINLGKQRTSLGVPLIRGNEPIGVILLARQRVAPFTDTQIELVKTFADQAVIAIENTRLLTEQREALDQQTATAEVLQVINASPSDLAPVFDVMLDKAICLSNAAFGLMSTYDGERFHTVAMRSVPAKFAAVHVNDTSPLGPEEPRSRIERGEDVIHVLDLADSAAYRSGDPRVRRTVDLGGARSYVIVPLRKEGTLLGTIAVYRQEVRAFSDRHITLLKNFAAQTVIAMENARLITETQEALAQQTATAEVLQVINASPGSLTPVFDAMLQRSMKLCNADYGHIHTFDGQQFDCAAIQGEPDFVTWRRQHNPIRIQRGDGNSTLERILAGANVVQFADALLEQAYRSNPPFREMVDVSGIRSTAAVALRKERNLLGTIVVYRREVQPFTEKQIALLQNFAAQAVIAIENARLLTEQREALEQQTATADILRVISSSPTDVQPTFDAIAESAVRLCAAASCGVFRFDGTLIHLVAQHGWAPEELEAVHHIYPHPPSRGGVTARAILTRAVAHVADTATDPEYAYPGIAEAGLHAVLSVPMLHDGKPIGAISITRREVALFAEAQIDLLKTFADQALIAIENVRLFTELRDRTNELAQRQAELQVTFENMGDGVALFDEAGHLAASNLQFQRILDVPDDVISSQPAFADYIRYLADWGEYGLNPEDHVHHHLALGSQQRVFERTRPNGRIIEVRVNPVPGGGFVVIYSDITDRKRNEEELRAARDAAEEAGRNIEAAYRELKAAQASLIQAEKMASLGQLTAGIAHEIKNPLNFVNNFASLSVDLLDELRQTAAPGLAILDEARRAEVDALTKTLASNLDRINEHGRRADGIVRSMLEHSRGSSGERSSVDINALAEEALNLAYHGARAQDQSFNVALRRDLAEGIAPITVVPQDVTRVLLNLFSNGFYAVRRRQRTKTVHDFEPTLGIATRELGEAVEISIRDNGIGIPDEIRDKLFQPFFTTKPTGEGTGLGLSISYDIITQQHGGRITVDSIAGQYTKFTIWLPRKP